MKVEKTGRKLSEKKAFLQWRLELSFGKTNKGREKFHGNVGFCSSSPVHIPSALCNWSQKTQLTSLACSTPIASSSAVTNEAVPAILADCIILTWVAVTLLGAEAGAGGFDSCGILRLCQLPDVLASSIDEQVSDTANIAVVQHGCPELCGKDESCPVLRQPTKVHVTFQIQNLTLPTSGEWGASAVHWYSA